MKADTPEYLKNLAKELLKTQTPAEKVLWEYLRRKQVSGCRFYRQYPIGRFILDFYCPMYKLVIEADGPIHDTEKKQAIDKEKDAYLIGNGLNILRFTNEQILSDINFVLDEISRVLNILRKDITLHMGYQGRQPLE